MTLPISCWAMEQHQEEDEECASQIVTASGSASASGVSGSDLDLESFSPKGLRVLVVDEDPVSLSLIERMLTQCEYVVTACRSVSQAISLIMDSAEGFNIVLCDVHLPGEDGFRLLDIFGSSPELPVVIMSVNGDTSMVMTGIMKGACDFLIKPVRMEELRNIWQHIVRKQQRRNGKTTTTRNSNNSNDDDSSKCNNNSNSDKCNSRGSEKAFRSADSVESICSLRIMNSSSNKRKSCDCNTIPTIESQLQTQQQHHHMIQDITGLKKARVHWTGQLHHQFVKAVNQLGLDRAVPKGILEIMNVQGLTRENVASHLQKYRLHLKRLSGRMPEPCPVASFQAAGDGKSGGKLQIRPRHQHPHQRQPRKAAPATLIPAPPAENSLAVSSTGEARIVTRQLQQSSMAVGVNEEEVELLDNMAQQCGLPLPCDEDFKSATVAEISLADYFLSAGDFLHHHHHHSTPPQQLC